MELIFKDNLFNPGDVVEKLYPVKNTGIVFCRRVLWGLFWFRVREWMFEWVSVKFIIKDKPVQDGDYWTYQVILSDKRYKIK